MSIKITDLVWKHYPAGGGELITALACADHAHDDGTSVRPSVAHIAKKTRQSERTVQRYLTLMREAGWLLTVRHGNGGRGRATEYRINPLWITNHAKLAPFRQTAEERVPVEPQKGDIRGMKRVTPMSPQSSLTIIEPTTTSMPACKHAPESLEDLSWPHNFSHVLRPSAKQILLHCPFNARQLVLDEVAGLTDRGRVRHPIALLRKLAECAKFGEFVPDAALEFQRKRDAQIQAEQQRRDLNRLRQEMPSLEARPPAKEKFAALREQLGRRAQHRDKHAA